VIVTGKVDKCGWGLQVGGEKGGILWGVFHKWINILVHAEYHWRYNI